MAITGEADKIREIRQVETDYARKSVQVAKNEYDKKIQLMQYELREYKKMKKDQMEAEKGHENIVKQLQTERLSTVKRINQEIRKVEQDRMKAEGEALKTQMKDMKNTFASFLNFATPAAAIVTAMTIVDLVKIQGAYAAGLSYIGTKTLSEARSTGTKLSLGLATYSIAMGKNLADFYKEIGPAMKDYFTYFGDISEETMISNIKYAYSTSKAWDISAEGIAKSFKMLHLAGKKDVEGMFSTMMAAAKESGITYETMMENVNAIAESYYSLGMNIDTAAGSYDKLAKRFKASGLLPTEAFNVLKGMGGWVRGLGVGGQMGYAALGGMGMQGYLATLTAKGGNVMSPVLSGLDKIIGPMIKGGGVGGQLGAISFLSKSFGIAPEIVAKSGVLQSGSVKDLISRIEADKTRAAEFEKTQSLAMEKVPTMAQTLAAIQVGVSSIGELVKLGLGKMGVDTPEQAATKRLADEFKNPAARASSKTRRQANVIAARGG